MISFANNVRWRSFHRPLIILVYRTKVTTKDCKGILPHKFRHFNLKRDPQIDKWFKLHFGMYNMCQFETLLPWVYNFYDNALHVYVLLLGMHVYIKVLILIVNSQILYSYKSQHMHQPISNRVLFKKYEINFACPIVTVICGKKRPI